jgi:integrase
MDPEAAQQQVEGELPYWHPHQLRHTWGTMVRQALGLDAARASMGHRELKMADEYAEKDAELARQAAMQFG